MNLVSKSTKRFVTFNKLSPIATTSTTFQYNNRSFSTESNNKENTPLVNDNKDNNKEILNNTTKTNKQGEHISNSRTITWASLLVAVVSGAAGWLYYDHLMSKKKERFNQIQTYGTSHIGGPFSLIDHTGKPVTDLDFRGKYMLLYFGFTYCPDACPAELDKITEVLQNLEKSKLIDSVEPVFITIDPWRDTVEQINIYVRDFHPKLIGLTGTPEQITKLAKAYRVFISKAGKGDSYLVDHTIITYLIGPDGRFIEFYGPQTTADQVTSKIIQRMAAGGKGGANTGEIVQEKSYFEKIVDFFK
eukprot:gene3182-3985_t